MKVAIMVPPKNFSDETLSVILLILKRWGVETVLTSYTTSSCVGLHGATYRPDINAARINSQDYDALILVDGPGVESYKLPDFKPAIDLTKTFIKSGKVIGAVGNAVKIFIRANEFTPVRISAQDNQEVAHFASTSRCKVTENKVEIYKNLITANGPGSAVEFSNAILDKFNLR